MRTRPDSALLTSTSHQERYKMWSVHSDKLDYSLLATLFNFQIRGLADRSLMEIEENVNPGTESWAAHE
jgi:hypothetical protein